MISLAIVADIRLYREVLAEILDRQPGIRVVGTASNDETSVRQITQTAPDVVLLDMAMPASASVARMLADYGAGIAVLALGVPETESHLQQESRSSATHTVHRIASASVDETDGSHGTGPLNAVTATLAPMEIQILTAQTPA